MARASRFLATASLRGSAASLPRNGPGDNFDWAAPVSGNYTDPLRLEPQRRAGTRRRGQHPARRDVHGHPEHRRPGGQHPRGSVNPSWRRDLQGQSRRHPHAARSGKQPAHERGAGQPGAVNFAGDFAILGDAGALPSIDNAGIVAKTAGNGGCQVPSVNFVSTGVLQIVSGSLLMTGGGSFSGVVDIATGGEIRLESGTYAVSAALPSQGTLRLGVGSTANLTAPVTVDHFAMDAGSVLDGQGSGLDVATYFQWAGGIVANTLLTVAPTASLDVLDNVTLTNASLQNYGVVNDRGPGTRSSRWTAAAW